MSIDHLLAQHDRILRAVEALEQVVDSPRDQCVGELAERRWTFTRDLLFHFSEMETSIYGPMRSDPRIDNAWLASRASRATARLAGDFREHAARWRGLPASALWQDYCAALKLLTARVREWLDAEVLLLSNCLPLPQIPHSDPLPDRNGYASQAWEMRQWIYEAELTSA